MYIESAKKIVNTEDRYMQTKRKKKRKEKKRKEKEKENMSKKKEGALSKQTIIKKWRWRASIPLPLACKANALPSELHPHTISFV